QRLGRFWTMDTNEGDPQAPPSLHKYLYAGADPIDRVDPSGRDWDLPSLNTAMAMMNSLAARSLLILTNVGGYIYFNLYRVPQIVDTVSNWLLFAQATTSIGGFIAKSVIETMASNLEDFNGKFSTGPSQMGSDVENVAGANLKRDAQSYDYYDAESQTVIQLKGTRQTSSPEALKGVVKGAINDLDAAPPKLNTFYRNAQPLHLFSPHIKIPH